MQDETTLRWGVIGIGWFGEIHAETLSRMSGIELAALSTRTESNLAEVGDRLNVAGRHTDYRELLDDASIDVVTITTHVDSHASIAVDALEAGKHVFLEVPMARTVDECDRILTAAKATDGFLTVGHVCRFDPRVTVAKEAIDAGRIGKIVSMHARRNLSRELGEQSLDKISALFGDGVHDADIMLWFGGARPVSVYAVEVHPGRSRFPDVGWALVRFDDDSVGVIEANWRLPKSTPYWVDARMEVIGTDGALYVDCASTGLEIHDESGASLPDTAYWPLLCGERDGALRAELRYFATCVREGTAPTHVTPEGSREVVRLMAVAAESARSGAPKPQ